MAPTLFEASNVPCSTDIIGMVDCNPSINRKIESSGTNPPVNTIPATLG